MFTTGLKIFPVCNGPRRVAISRLALMTPLLLASAACVTLPTAAAFRSNSLPIAAQSQLDRATYYAVDTREKLLESLQSQVDQRNMLRVATFIGTIATAGSLAFNGSRNLSAAFGIATGTTLAASALTTERGYDLSFDAAASALNCVGGSTRTAFFANVVAHKNLEIIISNTAILNDLDGLDPDDAVLRATAIARAELAEQRIPEVDLAGSGLASRAEISVDDIVSKARQQIITQIPNQAAFAATLSSVGTLGLGAATTIANSLPKPDAGASKAALRIPTPADIKIKLSGAIAAIDRAIAAIETSITASNGAIKTQLEGCGFVGVTIATPLVVSGLANDSIELAANINIRLQVSGGTLPYRADFNGIQPADIIRSTDGLGEIRLITGDKLVPGKTYTLEIRDTGNKVQTRTIKVMTK